MTYKESFIKFMVDSGVLTFGEFTLKSGRKAPYFINTGNYKTGAQLAKLGEEPVQQADRLGRRYGFVVQVTGQQHGIHGAGIEQG